MKRELRMTPVRLRRRMVLTLAVLAVVIAAGSAMVRLEPGHRAAGDLAFAVAIGAIPSVALLLVTAALPSLVRARLWWAVAVGVAIGLVAEVVLWAQTWLLLATAGVPASLCPILGGLVVLLFASPFALACLRPRRRLTQRVGVS